MQFVVERLFTFSLFIFFPFLLFSQCEEIDAGRDKYFCYQGYKSGTALSGKPKGGTWSGPGMQGNQFYHFDLDIGDHTVYYTIDLNDTTCVDSAIMHIESVPRFYNAGDDSLVCSSIDTLYLDWSFPEPTNWEFKPNIPLSKGVKGFYIQPDSIQSGEYLAIYQKILELDTSSCLVYDTLKLSISDTLGAFAGDDTVLCQGSGEFKLDGRPAGGRYEGPGLKDSVTFDPEISGSGSFDLKYISGDTSSCNNGIDDIKIEVKPILNPNIQEDTIICLSRKTSMLPQDSIKGIWEGPGVVEKLFFNSRITGVNTVKLAYIPDEQCGQTDSMQVSVKGSIAQFKLDPRTSDEAPLTVFFNNKSSASPNYWKWKINDTLELDAYDPIYTFYKNGSYNIELIVGDSSYSCYDSLVKPNAVQIGITGTSGIAESSYKLYPNPVTSNKRLSIAGPGRVTKIEIYNASGKLINQFEKPDNLIAPSIPGKYYLHFQSSKGKRFIYEIIIN